MGDRNQGRQGSDGWPIRLMPISPVQILTDQPPNGRPSPSAALPLARLGWLKPPHPPRACMFPFACSTPLDPRAAWSQHQDHKLRLLTAWRDATERRLAALNAAISTLERQIARDRPTGTN